MNQSSDRYYFWQVLRKIIPFPTQLMNLKQLKPLTLAIAIGLLMFLLWAGLTHRHYG